MWTERYGQTTVIYRDKEKYFSQTQSILPNVSQDDSFTVTPGRHVFPFVVQIPSHDMPTSYKGENGKVRYVLVAQLKRSLRMMKNVTTKFAFVSRTYGFHPEIMIPQHGAIEKDVVFFASGKISMNIYLEKTRYQLGEDLVIRGEIVNSSTRKIIPKYEIYQKSSFFAQGKRRLHISMMLKEKDTPLSSSTRQTVCKVLTVPPGITPSILNCRILKVEYRLKVILDVSFTKNPVIKFPVIFLPPSDGGGAKALEADQHHKPS
ncbi:arrestin domain-containing protein 3 isoform X2 [Brachyhypopomus gauderio]